MDKELCYLYAIISKTHYTNGSLLIKNNTGLKEINIKEPVFIEFDNQLVPFFIEKFEPKNSTSAIVKFNTILTIKQAEEYVGNKIYKHRETKEVEENKTQFEEYIGFMIYDKKMGSLGTIGNYTLIPGNPIWHINYKGKEILFPIHNDLIVKIDYKKEEITIDAPEGLIDMYINN